MTLSRSLSNNLRSRSLTAFIAVSILESDEISFYVFSCVTFSVIFVWCLSICSSKVYSKVNILSFFSCICIFIERLSGKSSFTKVEDCSKTYIIRSHACLRWVRTFLVVLFSSSSSEEEESWVLICFLYTAADLSPLWKVVSLLPAVVDKLHFEESIDWFSVESRPVAPPCLIWFNSFLSSFSFLDYSDTAFAIGLPYCLLIFKIRIIQN